jgi:hypothetical protein
MQLDVTGLGRQPPRSPPVPVNSAGVGAFVAASTDLFGHFGLELLPRSQPPSRLRSVLVRSSVDQLARSNDRRLRCADARIPVVVRLLRSEEPNFDERRQADG